MRGHGDSPLGPPDHVSISQFTDDLTGFITAKALGTCPVVGISMGAAIALRLAVLRPDLVRALVLARPAWVCDAAPGTMAPNAEVGAALARMPRAPSLRQGQRRPCSRRARPTIRHR